MGKLRSVSTDFWSDPFIEDLKPDEKLVFIYLITNSKTNMLGIYESSISKMSFETGVEKKRLETILKGFEGLGKVKYQNNYVILTNYLKHQNFNTNMKKSAIDCYNGLPNSLKSSDLRISKDNPLEGFERLSNHYGMVPKVEVEVEYEDELEDEDEDTTPPPFSFSKSLIELGAEKQLVTEWLKVRKSKTLTNSQTALNGFIREQKKSGKDINEVLKKCVEKSWGGFDSSWDWGNKPKTQSMGSLRFMT